MEHSTFNISENVSVIVPVLDPVEGPLSEVIAASEWQVVANIAMTSDDDECSRYSGILLFLNIVINVENETNGLETQAKALLLLMLHP